MTVFAERLRRFRRLRGGFGRDRSGVAAVEFAFIAAPFFFMMFAVLEVALVFFATTTLENATVEAAREIRTGRFQSGGGGAEQFRQAICDRAGMLINCDNLVVDVRTWQSFGAIDPSNPLNEDGELQDDEMVFQAGGRLDIVLVRVFYQWPVVTPILGNGFSNMAGNRRLLTSTAAFRNEPF